MSDPGQEALHRLDGHEKVCTERYGNIWSAMQRIEATQRSNAQTAHDRFNVISNRMWALLVTVASAAVVALLGGAGVIIFWLISRGGPK